MVLTAVRPKGREAAIRLKYEKTDITARIENDVESFHYTDVAASQSDSMSITINARNSKWKNAWMPEKGVKALSDHRSQKLGNRRYRKLQPRLQRRVRRVRAG